MADRILTWYIDTLVGDHTTQGPVHTLDQAYSPVACRVNVKRAPDAGDLEFDIKADGVSIFETLPRLKEGETSEDVAEDWGINGGEEIARYSLISLDLTPNGASGITVQLELVAADDERAASDT